MAESGGCGRSGATTTREATRIFCDPATHSSDVVGREDGAIPRKYHELIALVNGWKLMPRLELTAPATVSPDVLEVMAKSSGFRPATPMLVKVTLALVTLLTVMVCGELLLPTVTVPRFKEDGVSLIAVPV